MMRKTLDRYDVIKIANNRLAAPGNAINNPEARAGLMSYLESILFEHDMYNGFSYLPAHMLDDETDMPGIRGSADDTMDARFADTDPTRRRYF